MAEMFNEDLGVYFKSRAHGLFLLQLLLRHFNVEVNQFVCEAGNGFIVLHLLPLLTEG